MSESQSSREKSFVLEWKTQKARLFRQIKNACEGIITRHEAIGFRAPFTRSDSRSLQDVSDEEIEYLKKKEKARNTKDEPFYYSDTDEKSESDQA